MYIDINCFSSGRPEDQNFILQLSGDHYKFKNCNPLEMSNFYIFFKYNISLKLIKNYGKKSQNFRQLLSVSNLSFFMPFVIRWSMFKSIKIIFLCMVCKYDQLKKNDWTCLKKFNKTCLSVWKCLKLVLFYIKIK